MKKYLLFLLPILALSLASALDLTLENPHSNHTYTHSTGLPLDLTATGDNGTCWYEIDTCYINKVQKTVCSDIHGVPIADCEDIKYSVSYDGNYTIQVFAANGTDVFNVNVSYNVNRTSEFEEGKPLIISMVILFLISIGFFTLLLAGKLEESVPVIKVITLMIGVFSMVVASMVTYFALAEYVKFPILEEFLSLYGWLVFMLVFFVIIYVVLYFFKTAVYPLMRKKI